MTEIHFLVSITARNRGGYDYPFRLGDALIAQNPGKVSYKVSCGLPEFSTVRAFDLLSLQYIPHGFERRGLPVHLPNSLKRAVGDRPVQIMLHELWRGDLRDDPLKLRLGRYVQILILRQLVSKLRPVAVHCSNPYDQMRLQQIGLRAEILPLISNIAISSRFQRQRPEKGEPWKLAIFGSIRADWKGDPDWFRDVNASLAKSGQQIQIVMMGKISEKHETMLRSICAEWDVFLEPAFTGPLSPEEISDQAMLAHGGLICTPLHIAGKSGGGATLRIHGLPIFVTNKGVSTFTLPADPQVCADTDAETMRSHLQKTFKAHDIIGEVAAQFSKDVRLAT